MGTWLAATDVAKAMSVKKERKQHKKRDRECTRIDANNRTTTDERKCTQIGKSTSDVIGGRKNKNSRKDANGIYKQSAA
jgi:prophage antirepressor-like protein